MDVIFLSWSIYGSLKKTEVGVDTPIGIGSIICFSISIVYYVSRIRLGTKFLQFFFFLALASIVIVPAYDEVILFIFLFVVGKGQ